MWILFGLMLVVLLFLGSGLWLYNHQVWPSMDPDGGSIMPAGTVATASGNSGWIYVGNVNNIVIVLDVSAVAGTTPSMALNVTTTYSNVDIHSVAVPGGAFTAVTAAGQQIISITTFQGYIQLNWTITGTTPSFTFGIFAAARH